MLESFVLRLLKLKDEVIEEDRTRYNLILRNVTIDKKYEFIGFIK